MNFDPNDPFFVKLKEGFNFPPTPSQELAMKGLSMIVKSATPRPTLVIDGFAGTGKTTLMKVFCDTAADFGIPVILMAPTGRAAKVLSNYTGKSASTIHRLIYRQDSSMPDSAFSRSFNKWHRAVFIVDEASMIGDSYKGVISDAAPLWGDGRLLSDLIDFVFSQDGSRLILIGDPDQLPPVGCDSAPALDVPYLKSFGLTVGHVRLTDVVRQQSESLILKNSLSIRSIIESEEAPPEGQQLPQLAVHDGSDVEQAAGDSLLEKIEQSFSSFGTQDVVLITRSNKRATQYNVALRSQVFYYEDLLVKGDLLIVNKNNYLWAEKAGCNFIANGDVAEVVSIFGYSEMYGLHFADVSLHLIDRNDIDIDCKILLDYLTADIQVVDPETNIPRILTTEQISQMLNKGAEEDYADYTNQRKKAKDMREDPWLNALQVRYAYALTCHKAQGGQWRAVFVDPGYIPPEADPKELSKWVYTAISRAREQLYLINYPRVEHL